MSYSLHTFALTTREQAWQTVFLASILPTITAQFAPTSNDYQQIFWSRCKICHSHFKMVFNTAAFNLPVFWIQLVAFSHPLLHLKIAPRAVVARSCSRAIGEEFVLVHLSNLSPLSRKNACIVVHLSWYHWRISFEKTGSFFCVCELTEHGFDQQWLKWYVSRL